ncbi:unnamed protein product [Lampetra planeri]
MAKAGTFALFAGMLFLNGDPPVVNITTSDYNWYVGMQNVTLYCQACPSSPWTNYIWISDAVNFTVGVDLNCNIIRFLRPLTELDAGNYSCIIDEGNNNSSSATIEISFEELSTVTEGVTELSTFTETMTVTELSTFTETMTVTEPSSTVVTEEVTESSTVAVTDTEPATSTEPMTITETITVTDVNTEPATVTEPVTDTGTVSNPATDTVTVTDPETDTATVTDPVTDTATVTNPETDTGTVTNPETTSDPLVVTITTSDYNWYVGMQNVTLYCQACPSSPWTNYMWISDAVNFASGVDINCNFVRFLHPLTELDAGNYSCIVDGGSSTTIEISFEELSTVTEGVTELSTFTETMTVTELSTFTETMTVTEPSSTVVTDVVTDTEPATSTEPMTITETITVTDVNTETATVTEPVTDTGFPLWALILLTTLVPVLLLSVVGAIIYLIHEHCSTNDSHSSSSDTEHGHSSSDSSSDSDSDSEMKMEDIQQMYTNFNKFQD